MSPKTRQDVSLILYMNCERINDVMQDVRHAVAQLVEALRYTLEDRGFDEATGFFSLI